MVKVRVRVRVRVSTRVRVRVRNLFRIEAATNQEAPSEKASQSLAATI